MQVLAELDRDNHYVKLRFLRVKHPLRPEFEGVIAFPTRSEAVLKANRTKLKFHTYLILTQWLTARVAG